MPKMIYWCTDCRVRPQAPNGWYLCWACETRLDAERLIAAGERQIAEGRRKLAIAQALAAEPLPEGAPLGPYPPPFKLSDLILIGRS